MRNCVVLWALAGLLVVGCGSPGGNGGGGVLGVDASVDPDLVGGEVSTGDAGPDAQGDAGPDGTGDTGADTSPDVTGPVCPATPCKSVGISCFGNAQLSCVLGPDDCLVGTESPCTDGQGEPVACDQFSGQCVAACTGAAAATNPQGLLKLDLTEVSFDSATVEIEHKRDVDAFEDGCISGVTVRLTRPGCQLTARTDASVHETDPDGNLVIRTLTFSADSACPGFPDAKEGSYQASAQSPWTAAGLNLGVIALGTDTVPGQDVAASCFVSTMELRLFPSELKDSSKTLAVLETTIVLSGEFTSVGDVDNSCPCAARSTKDCTGVDGSVAVRWEDSCGRPNDLFDTCVGNEECAGVGVAMACVCPEHWEGEGCDVCPGNWDEAQGCDVCRNLWEGADCEVCPGNYDPADDCGSCRNGWTGEDCTVCPPNFDESQDCGVCRNHWSGEDCETCPEAVDEETDCSACWVRWPSSGPYDYPGCYDVLRAYPLAAGTATQEGTALADDGRIYVGTSSGVQAYDAERKHLWTVSGGRPIVADGAVYVQSSGGFRRYTAEGESMWTIGDIGNDIFGSPGLPTFDLQGRFWTPVELPYKTLVHGTDGKLVTSYETISEPDGSYALDAGGTVIYRPYRWTVPDYDDPDTPWFEWAEGPRVQAVRVSDGEVLWELQRPVIQNDTHVQVSARAGGGVMIADLWGYLVLDAAGNEVFEPDGDPKSYNEMTVGEDGSIYAADSSRIRRWSATGTLMWETEFILDGFSRTPTIAADGSAYVGVELDNGAKGIIAYEPDGDARWGFSAQAACSDPVIDADSWLWTACGGYLFRLPASAPLASSPWPRYRGGNGNAGR